MVERLITENTEITEKRMQARVNTVFRFRSNSSSSSNSSSVGADLRVRPLLAHAPGSGRPGGPISSGLRQATGSRHGFGRFLEFELRRYSYTVLSVSFARMKSQS